MYINKNDLDLLEEILNNEIIAYLESGYPNTSEYVILIRNLLKKLNLKEICNYDK